ncbi:MAG: threonine dehydratase [Actinomycetota bacterium]|jgi:threonine dehydratase|nr:threonine dehydratase [Actinomycetota bacterium]
MPQVAGAAGERDRQAWLDDARAAAKLLEGVARRTPVETSRALAELTGGEVYLKCENLQRAGSFKIRGAYVRIARLTDEQRAGGVVAASAGNHAQGVALAASLLGAKATVFMPEGAPLPKVEATRNYGADIHFFGHSVDEALVEAKAHAEKTGAVLIHPFDHPDIVAGQATTGLEILEQCPQVRTILVGAGGGGLVSGIAVVAKALRPDIAIVGVQAEGAAAFPGSLAAGTPIALDSMTTIADGIAVGCPGDLTLGLVRDNVDRIVTVSEEALSRALLFCLERTKLVVEPAGVAAVAALMDAPGDFEAPVVAVLSGGNVDPLLLVRILRHGLAAAGRYLSFHVRIADRPGALAALLHTLADAGGNVLDVVHERTAPTLHIDEVEVALQVETRGPSHSAEVLELLRAQGYPVAFS